MAPLHKASVPHKLRGELALLPEGTVVSPNAFLHLGTRAAVDQALSRFARSGEVIRIQRGLYTTPVQTRFGTRPPSVHLVLNSLAAATGEAIEPPVAATANTLGLTTQVPIRQLFLTSGRPRSLQLGTQTIELRKASGWLTGFRRPETAEAIRALTWLHGNSEGKAPPAVMKHLSGETRRELLSARHRMPRWLAEAVSRSANA